MLSKFKALGTDRVVGVDPGLTTGLCCIGSEGLADSAEALRFGEIVDFIRVHDPMVVVMEDYIIGRRPARPKEPLGVIGVVKYICEEDERRLVIQSPGILSRMMPKMTGIHRSKHIRSACAHVMYYLETGD